MNPEQEKALSPSNLSNFIGSEEFFSHALRKSVVMTEGVHFITENGLAWLVDIVASVQHLPFIKAEEFQVWKLKKREGDGAEVFCEDGNGKQVYRQEIPYTDFPYETFELFAAANGEGVTVMLPSEY